MTPAEAAAFLRNYNVWRRGNLDDQPMPDPREIGKAIDAAAEMIDRLEAAEKERDTAELMSLALRSKIAEMEQQEPVEWQSRTRPVWNDGMWTQWSKCSEGYAKDIMKASLVNDWIYEARPLYAIPVVQAAPSVPDGWLRAIDEALVTAHIGVANAEDTYEQAKAKLDNLIGFHVDVATDPAVNGGWKLMPIEPTREIYECFAAYDGTSYSNPFDFDDFREDYLAAINSTGLPVEAKLYALPGAQPTPSVPDDIVREVLRDCCGTFHGSRHRITCEKYKGEKAPETKP